MAGEQLFSKPPLGARLNMAHPLALNLTGCWLLNEQMGLRAMDLSPYGNHGLLVGFPLHPRDTYGYVFDGTNDKIECGTSNSLDVTGDFTFEVWAKPTGTTVRTLISRHTDTYMFQIGTFGAGVEQELTLYVKAGWRRSSANINNDAWNHLMVVYDGTNSLFYIGANLVATIATSGVYNEGVNETRIGVQSTSDNPFNGSLGLARIWKRALTKDEVKALYISPYAPMGTRMFV